MIIIYCLVECQAEKNEGRELPECNTGLVSVLQSSDKGNVVYTVLPFLSVQIGYTWGYVKTEDYRQERELHGVGTCEFAYSFQQ